MREGSDEGQGDEHATAGAGPYPLGDRLEARTRKQLGSGNREWLQRVTAALGPDTLGRTLRVQSVKDPDAHKSHCSY